MKIEIGTQKPTGVGEASGLAVLKVVRTDV